MKTFHNRSTMKGLHLLSDSTVLNLKILFIPTQPTVHRLYRTHQYIREIRPFLSQPQHNSLSQGKRREAAETNYWSHSPSQYTLHSIWNPRGVSALYSCVEFLVLSSLLPESALQGFSEFCVYRGFRKTIANNLRMAE